MKKAWLVLELVFALASLAIACYFFTYTWPDEEFGLSSWVQAIGSITAIVGAYWVGERQVNAAAESAKRMHASQELKRQASYLAIATAARDYVSDISSTFYMTKVDKFRLFMKYHEQIARDYIAAMNAVPIHDLGSPECVKEWFATKNAMMYFEKALSFYVEHVNDDFGGDPEKRAGNPSGVTQCAGYMALCYDSLARVMEPNG